MKRTVVVVCNSFSAHSGGIGGGWWRFCVGRTDRAPPPPERWRHRSQNLLTTCFRPPGPMKTRSTSAYYPFGALNWRTGAWASDVK